MQLDTNSDFGDYLVGQFMGIALDEQYGDTLRIRVADPVEGGKTPTGYEERVDFYRFDPRNGNPTLPRDLVAGLTVVVKVRVKSKGYRSQDRGISGMITRELQNIVILDDPEKVKALNLLTEMEAPVADGE